MPLGIELLIAVLIGGTLGFLLGRLAKPGGGGSDSRLESELRQQISELRQQIIQRESDLAQLRADLTVASNARAAAEAKIGASERMLAEQRALQEKALLDLREAFKALSADALKQTQPEFLRLANETLGKFQESAKGDLAQRQESIKTLVEPLKLQLETYQKRLQQSESAQSRSLGEVKKQLETLAQSNQTLAAETLQFRMVLKSNQARGKWGEETLRRVVEAAGMSAHCDFSEQTQSGDNRPDLIVRLPGDRLIIVDAKVPDLDFLSALDNADTTKRAESLAMHAAKLKQTIKLLAARNYPKEFPGSLDHVVLFLPAESLFSAALEGDHQLIVWAAAEKIMLATPASLIALLRSVSVSWQQHAQSENALKIVEAAQELYSRVVTFSVHFKKIRDGLDSANRAFNQAVGSYDSRIVPAGEKIQKLSGATNGKEMAEVPALDNTLSLPSA